MAGFPYHVSDIVPTPVGVPLVAGDTATGLLVPIGGSAQDGMAVQDRLNGRRLDELIANVKQLCHLMVWSQGPPGINPPVVPGSCLDIQADGQVQ